jgi:tail tube GTA-gp10-like protein
MSNPHKGEVPFKAGDQEYILSFSANALVETVEALGLDLDELIERFGAGKIKLTQMRVMFWQGLCDHHENISLDDTKKILKLLQPADMGQLLGKAFALSMPKPEDAPSPPEPGGPESGTGPASSTPGLISEEAKPNSGG